MTRQDPSGWPVRWDQQRADSLVAGGYWSGRTMDDYARHLVARSPDHVIVVDGEKRFTARAIYNAARRMAGAFVARGLEPGQRISYQLPNWHEAIIVDLAATMAGLIVNPLVPIYREAEIGFMMDDLGSRMLFVPSRFRNNDYVRTATRALERCESNAEIVVVRGEGDHDLTTFEQLLASGDPNAPLPVKSPDDIKLALYTSGTTGRAKAVLHSHNTVSAMAEQYVRHMAIGAQDVTLVSSPVTHITGAMLAFQLPWIAGTRAVMMDVWDGPRAVDLIRTEAISICNGAAPFIVDLVDAARKTADRLPSLRVFIAGGSTIPEALARSAYDALENCVLFRAYGATEVPAATMGEPDAGMMGLNISTDGHPVETELRIIDTTTGQPVAHGEEGEILMSGPQCMLGYLRPEDNDNAFDAEGFFRSGDLGRFVEDGWIEVTGRAKDIIIRAGENLSPKEIEEALLDHPAVADIAIVAKPDQRTGEAACAFVVPADGQTPTIQDFAAFLIERGFAKQKIPEFLILTDALPTTPAGKVQKHILREQAKQAPD